MNSTERDLYYIQKLWDLINCSEQPKRLLEKKVSGFTRVRSLLHQYTQFGFRDDLLSAILKKKLDHIRNANSAAEVDRAANPPKPKYNYGTWIEDPLTVPEEELVLWSIASMHRLKPEAQDRFISLMCTVYGITREQIMSNSFPSDFVALTAQKHEPDAADPPEAEMQDMAEAWRIGHDRFLALQTCDGGYDYTLYDADYSEVDGGQLDNPELSVPEAREEILKSCSLEKEDIQTMDYASLMTRIHERE